MKLTPFMTVLKTKKSKEDKEGFIIEHIKNEYVPYEMKADVAKRIVDSCYYIKKANNDVEQHILHVDSVAKYMLTCMSIVDLYTDIERTKKDGKMLEDFNTLNGSGVLDVIIQHIDQRELKEFNMILQMTCDDVMTNEYEPHAFVKGQIERFGSLIGVTLSQILKQLDLEKIQKIMNEIN